MCMQTRARVRDPQVPSEQQQRQQQLGGERGWCTVQPNLPLPPNHEHHHHHRRLLLLLPYETATTTTTTTTATTVPVTTNPPPLLLGVDMRVRGGRVCGGERDGR